MARPTPFDRQTSFAQFSAQFPAKPQNGASIDAEFNAVKVALDETQSNLNSLQDDDGALARGSVGRAQLDASITLGFGAPSAWAAGTAYDANASTVFHTGIFYIATVTHTSGDTFDASKWEAIADFSTSNSIDDGSITDAKLAANSVTAEKIAPLAVTEPKIASGAVSTAKIANEAITLAKLAAALPAQLRDLVLPAGLGPLPWSGSAAPAGWVFTGATYLRADYPSLWALAAYEIANTADTFYGAGDGSTTFTIKSMVGRTPVGVDPLGSVVGGLSAVGQTAGAADVALTTANLPPYTPAGSITNGAITSTPNQSQVVTGAGGLAFGSGSGGGLNALTVSSTQAASTFAGTPQGGTSTAFPIIQPSMAVNFIVKAH